MTGHAVAQLEQHSTNKPSEEIETPMTWMALDEFRANLPQCKKTIVNGLLRVIQLDNFVRLPEVLDTREDTE